MMPSEYLCFDTHVALCIYSMMQVLVPATTSDCSCHQPLFGIGRWGWALGVLDQPVSFCTYLASFLLFWDKLCFGPLLGLALLFLDSSILVISRFWEGSFVYSFWFASAPVLLCGLVWFLFSSTLILISCYSGLRVAYVLAGYSRCYRDSRNRVVTTPNIVARIWK